MSFEEGAEASRQVCEQSEPLSNLCCWGELGGSQGPLRPNMHLPTEPGAPQGEGLDAFHICVPGLQNESHVRSCSQHLREAFSPLGT